jgi:hypothetical protein
MSICPGYVFVTQNLPNFYLFSFPITFTGL